MPKRFTDRQKRYVKRRLENPMESKFESAIAAGYAENTARHQIGSIERGLPTEMKDTLDQAGLDDAYVVNKIRELTNAKKIVFVNGEEKEVPDNAVCVKALEMLCKLRKNFTQTREAPKKLHTLNQIKTDKLVQILNKEPEDKT